MQQQHSKPFCLLPWIHMHFMPDGDVIPCCVSPYDDIYGNVKNESLEDIFNSPKYKNLRLEMLKGIPPSGCAHCVDLERAGFRSMRRELNHRFSHLLPLLEKTEEDGKVSELPLKYFDVRFSNLCNFKCRGCGPTLSSAWAHELRDNKVQSLAKHSPQIWEELKKKLTEPEIIYFGGGEPLISEEHFELLNELIRLERFDVILKYNTNLSTLTYKNVDLMSLWSRFKKVNISVSLDDIGKRAEYFRHGTKWPVIEKNLVELREKAPQIERTVNCTVHLFNIYYLPELVFYLLDHQFVEPLNFNVNLLLDPLEYRLDVIPSALKQKIKNKLLKFKIYLEGAGEDYLKLAHDISGLIHFMMAQDLSSHLPTFKARTQKLDSLRKEDFLATFPELSELLL